MIRTQEGIRTITSSEAEENEIGDYVLVRIGVGTKLQMTIVGGWRLLGVNVFTSLGRGYIDSVYCFGGRS